MYPSCTCTIEDWAPLHCVGLRVGGLFMFNCNNNMSVCLSLFSLNCMVTKFVLRVIYAQPLETTFLESHSCSLGLKPHPLSILSVGHTIKPTDRSNAPIPFYFNSTPLCKHGKGIKRMVFFPLFFVCSFFPLIVHHQQQQTATTSSS